MGKPGIVFDPEIYGRATSLLASKRSDLDPAAIVTLASEIVRHLAVTAPRRITPAALEIPEASIAAFCDVLVQPDPTAALEFIRSRRAEGVSPEDAYLGYIAVAARRLGTAWDEDRISFVEVTYGTGHLYALMRALRADRPRRPGPIEASKRALFATVPGEDHGIGITMAADLFRENGWDIILETDTDHDALVACADRMAPKIIGLSLSTERRLEALIRLVVALRLIVPDAIIGVAPGGDLDADWVRSLADIDLMFADATSARHDLDRLVRLHG